MAKKITRKKIRAVRYVTQDGKPFTDKQIANKVLRNDKKRVEDTEYNGVGNTMTFEILITTYNRPKELKECIESILKFHPTVTISVFNDASTEDYSHLLPFFKEHNIFYAEFPENRGSNYNNQRALSYFEKKGVDRWVILDDDVVYEGPFLTELQKLFDEGYLHIYTNHPNLTYTRPRGVFLAGTKELLEVVGGFDLEKFHHGYGGCHPSWTWRAINAGIAAPISMDYYLQKIRSSCGGYRTAWKQNELDYEDVIKKQPTYHPIDFPEKEATND